MKIIIIIILSIMILSCHYEPSIDREDLNNIVILENAFINVDLYYTNNSYETKIFLKNINNMILIELNYTLNNKDYIINKAIVPNEIINLYNSNLDDKTFSCKINNLLFY